MNAVGYVRVSTIEQAKEGVSLDSQESRIRAYALLHDLNLREIIRDEGESGKSLKRYGIEWMLDEIRSGMVDAVIVLKLDRLSRSTKDTLFLMDFFKERGVAFHSINEKIDTESATGKFFLTIIAAFSEMERDLIAERTREALAHKKRIGEWCGRAPFGFKIKNGVLVEDPEQMRIIRKARSLRRGKAKMSYPKIGEKLGLSPGYVHKIVNTDLRVLKKRYIRGRVG